VRGKLMERGLLFPVEKKNLCVPVKKFNGMWIGLFISRAVFKKIIQFLRKLSDFQEKLNSFLIFQTFSTSSNFVGHVISNF
jgi:hypothetical protein